MEVDNERDRSDDVEQSQLHFGTRYVEALQALGHKRAVERRIRGSFFIYRMKRFVRFAQQY